MRQLSVWLFASFVVVNFISGYVNGTPVVDRSAAAMVRGDTTIRHTEVVLHPQQRAH